MQKILSARGVASRRQAEEMILAGRVSCNGLVSHLGDSADPETDSICVDGVPIPCDNRRVYLMLNKPRGFVTTLSDEKGRRTVKELVSDCGERVYPVGRLDMDSEGLLLLTNDGEFANHLMHPKHQVDKTYRVWVKGFEKQSVERLLAPMSLDGYALRTPDVKVINCGLDKTAILEITIHEGRNRQVRRMCAIAGMQVKKLLRVREGKLILGGLESGKWRYLTPEEVDAL